MDYETARRVRGRSVKDLTIRNIEMGGGIVGSYKGAVGANFKAAATRIQEKFDPLRYVSMLNSPLTTAIVGRLFGRKGSTIRYFNEQQREKQRNKAHYSKVGSGRATRLKVGDSTADILAKMLNLMQKEHDENLKRWELESEHNQQRKEEEDRRHNALLKAIGGGVESRPEEKKAKGKSFFEKFKEEMVKIFETIKEGFVKATKLILGILDDIWLVFKDVLEGVLTVFEFLGKLVGHIVNMVFDAVLGAVKYIPGIAALIEGFKLFKSKIIDKLVEHELTFKKIYGLITSLYDFIIEKSTEDKAEKMLSMFGPYGKALSAILSSQGGLDVFEELKKTQNNEEKNEVLRKFYEKHKDTIGADPNLGGSILKLFGMDFNDLKNTLSPEEAELNKKASLSHAFSFSDDINSIMGFFGDPVDKTKEAQGQIISFGPDAYQYLKDSWLNGKTKEEAMKDSKFIELKDKWQNTTLSPALSRTGIAINNSGNFVSDGKIIPPEDLWKTFTIKNYNKLKEEQGVSDSSSLLKTTTDLFKTGIDKLDSKKMDLEMSHGIETLRSKQLSITPNLSEMTDKIRGTYNEVFNKGDVVVNKTVNNIPAPPAKTEEDDETPVRTTDPSLLRCQMNYAVAC